MNRTTASGVVHGMPREQRELYPSRGARSVGREAAHRRQQQDVEAAQDPKGKGRAEEFKSSLSAGEFSCRVIEGEW